MMPDPGSTEPPTIRWSVIASESMSRARMIGWIGLYVAFAWRDMKRSISVDVQERDCRTGSGNSRSKKGTPNRPTSVSRTPCRNLDRRCQPILREIQRRLYRVLYQIRLDLEKAGKSGRE